MKMKKTILALLLLMLATLTGWAQPGSVLDELKQTPRKAYGGDFPYPYIEHRQTPAPEGYTPFYVSHYARHGSRYYWTARLYRDLDTLLTAAHQHRQLTAEGEAFYGRYKAALQELLTGAEELTQLGWEQHQWIARRMYDCFPEVFSEGGNVLAVSSMSRRCMLSMSAFCQELVQCNPAIEIREQTSRFTLDGVVPFDHENPVKHNYPDGVKPRYEQHRDLFTVRDELPAKVLQRVFTSTDSLPGTPQRMAANLIDLYTSLPSIGHEGMMGAIVTDDELVQRWEVSNLGSYSWVFGPQYVMIPILQDIIRKADAAIVGQSDRIADLRFGHDNCLGPLTVLMGINGADRDPADPNEVKNVYQNWQTCKAANLQLVFYRGNGDVLVKCLLNGAEASLPVSTDSYPFYRWTDVRRFYQQRIESVSN